MTPVQLRVLDSIREHLAVSGVSPSYRELAKECDTSLGSIHKTVECLIREGLLTRRPAARRSLALARAPDLRPVPTEALVAELKRRGVTSGALDRDGTVRQS